MSSEYPSLFQAVFDLYHDEDWSLVPTDVFEIPYTKATPQISTVERKLRSPRQSKPSSPVSRRRGSIEHLQTPPSSSPLLNAIPITTPIQTQTHFQSHTEFETPLSMPSQNYQSQEKIPKASNQDQTIFSITSTTMTAPTQPQYLQPFQRSTLQISRPLFIYAHTIPTPLQQTIPFAPQATPQFHHTEIPTFTCENSFSDPIFPLPSPFLNSFFEESSTTNSENTMSDSSGFEYSLSNCSSQEEILCPVNLEEMQAQQRSYTPSLMNDGTW
eukprot:TRINITY_DN2880_c0_g1_i3.p1 TRINITY_DN2880_c0_g1~~TRINITY_DN2880_c0_g1_i3.p1  ORF type:complete len:271 (-),score=71.66 TRINITY_DN2880_c0_g1_i3:369-1181(-)